MDDSDTKSSSSSVTFRRRLDRTPDKNFEKLPDEEKVRLSTLRKALEDAKVRIARLRDENDLKDDAIEEERMLRHAAEEKLQNYLVDLYNNPDVNSELRKRLPRAKKHDPLQQTRGKDMKGNENYDVNSKDDGNDGGSESSEKEPLNETKLVSGPDPSSVFFQPVIITADSDSTEAFPLRSDQQDSKTSQTETFSASPPKFGAANSQNLLAPAQSHADPGESTSWQPFPVMPPYPLYATPAMLTSALYPVSQMGNPLSSASFSSLASSYQGLPPRMAGSGHSQAEDGPSDKGAEAGPQVWPGGITAQLHTQPTVAEHTDQEPLTSTQSTAKPTPMTFSYGYPPPNVSSLMTAPGVNESSWRSVYGRDNVSHITRLLAEIATLKQENHQLKSELQDTRRDLESAKVDAKLGEETDLEAVGALIEEVRSAQKEREKAVSKLVEAAEEDRDAALGELDRLRLSSVKRSQPNTSLSDSELSDIEDRDDGIADSGSSLDDSGAQPRWCRHPRSLRHVERLAKKQREVMQHNLEVVISQRDQAQSQVSKLEKKLSDIQLSDFAGTNTQMLMAKLRVVEKERDFALAKLRILSQDMDETKLVYSLHKALVADNPHNKTSFLPASKMKNIDLELEGTKNNNMAAQLSKAGEEKQKLEAQLEILEEEKKTQDMQIQELSDLVKRQRVKLNNLCSGPMLIED